MKPRVQWHQCETVRIAIVRRRPNERRCYICAGGLGNIKSVKPFLDRVSAWATPQLVIPNTVEHVLKLSRQYSKRLPEEDK